MESRESVDVDFRRYLLMLKRQRMPAMFIFLGTVVLSVIVAALIKPSYETHGELLFKIPSFQTVGSNLLPSSSEGEATGDLRPLVSTQNPISSQIEVISSPALLQQVIEKLGLKDNKGKLLEVEEMQKILALKTISGTDVLRVAYKSHNPKEAAAVVNTLMNLYLENDILVSRFEARATRNSIAGELPEIEDAVYRSEVALRRFKENKKIVDLLEEAKSAVAITGSLDKDIDTAQAELDQTNAQVNELRQKVNLNSHEALAVSALSQSPAVQGTLTQLQELERQLATERSRFRDDTPTIINLKAKKAKLQSLLENQTKQTIGSQTNAPQELLHIGELKQKLIEDFLQSEVRRIGLAKKLASLYNSRNAYAQRVKIIPQLEQTQRGLERQVEVAQSTYQILLKKVQELQVAENKNTANARIVAQALVPKKPVLGNKPIILLLGVMFGAFFSTTTVLFLETRDRSLKTLKEIRDVFEYVLLGIIPLFPKKVSSRQQNAESIKEITVRDTPRSLISKTYRMIQASLYFLSSDKALKTIVVTSSVPKEGKSTVAANLAAAIAQVGRQVLLIDADMRFPSQHHLWQLTNAVGLSEVLVGKAEFKTATCKVMDNLDVLTSGVKLLNPLSFIDSKEMASLIKDFSAQYDFVIIDTPPLLSASDALALSLITDGILLVARPGVVDSSSAAIAKEMLEDFGHNVLGLLVNGV